jgi:hypothetical protein
MGLSPVEETVLSSIFVLNNIEKSTFLENSKRQPQR